MIGQIRHGTWPLFTGAHVVMPNVGAGPLGGDRYVTYLVWEIRQRDRGGNGWAMCVAAFLSKIQANKFARERNVRPFARREEQDRQNG